MIEWFSFVHELKSLPNVIVNANLKWLVDIAVIHDWYHALSLNCNWVINYWANWVLNRAVLIGN